MLSDCMWSKTARLMLTLSYFHLAIACQFLAEGKHSINSHAIEYILAPRPNPCARATLMGNHIISPHAVEYMLAPRLNPYAHYTYGKSIICV